MKNPAISLIQTGLRDLGYGPGPVDGYFGARTRAAAEAWIAASGRAVTAVLKPETDRIVLQGPARIPVHEVIIHCADTPPTWMADKTVQEQAQEIRRWHIEERGWKDIGYHWVIGRAGAIAAGRRETMIGAHCEGHNAGTLGICLIGGKGSNADDPFLKNFTPAQDVSLRQLLQGIGMRTQITTISGHNDYAARACPGFDVTDWLKGAIS